MPIMANFDLYRILPVYYIRVMDNVLSLMVPFCFTLTERYQLRMYPNVTFHTSGFFTKLTFANLPVSSTKKSTHDC